ncbi:hypothetical protein [Streptomyces huasconensis]|uniref:hypothetical protein n=1 Tax=Streptomyces huasconensis TaxID=1854574 RepID=UPI0033E33702
MTDRPLRSTTTQQLHPDTSATNTGEHTTPAHTPASAPASASGCGPGRPPHDVPDEEPAEKGCTDVIDALKAEARAVTDMVSTHDTHDFLRRLAARVAEQAARPPRIQRETTPVPPRTAETIAPAATPSAYTLRPTGTARPLTRRTRRRRPTPIVTHDPAAHPQVVRAYLRLTCETVLRSDDVDHMLFFDHDYNQAGARTFACLLYCIDRTESALFWWGFAAGVGDPLAAHLLAVYHALDDTHTQAPARARAWRAFARLLHYHPDHHLPRPVQGEPRIAEGLARPVPWKAEIRDFMMRDPAELTR